MLKPSSEEITRRAEEMNGIRLAQGVKYDMVQPAYVLLDRSGAVLQRLDTLLSEALSPRKWSWRSFDPVPEMQWSTKVKLPGGEEGVLVRARPCTEDLLASIKERRAPKLGLCQWLGD